MNWHQRERDSTLRRWLVMALAAALLLGVGNMLVRGVVRGLEPEHGRDFAWVSSCARGWLDGADPYTSLALDESWKRADGAAINLPSLRDSCNNVYPPSTFVVLTPISALPWPVARLAWMALNITMVAVIIWSLLSIVSVRLTSPTGLLVATWTCAGAPIVTSLAHGQTAIVVFAAIAAAHAMRLSSRPIASGLLIGIAAALKPQIGLVFLAIELFRRRFVAAGAAMSVVAVAATIGVARLHSAGIEWVTTLSENVSTMTSGGHAGDPAITGSMRAHLTNLHVPLHALTDDRQAVTTGVWLIVGAIAAAFGAIWLRKRDDQRDLLALSMASCLLLLIVYHRSYDAIVLLFPVVWAITGVRDLGWRKAALPHIIVLLCAAVFAVPGGAALVHFESQGKIPSSISDSAIYQCLIEGHQPIALLIMAFALLWTLGQLPPAPMAWRMRNNDKTASHA